MARLATLSPGFDPELQPVLIPEYELINQTGTDVQYTIGAWLWKLEALFRQGQRNRVGEEDYINACPTGNQGDVVLLANARVIAQHK